MDPKGVRLFIKFDFVDVEFQWVLKILNEECIPAGFIPPTSVASTSCQYWGLYAGGLSRGGLYP